MAVRIGEKGGRLAWEWSNVSKLGLHGSLPLPPSHLCHLQRTMHVILILVNFLENVCDGLCCHLCCRYFVLAELLIFLDHYWLLHKVEAGKRTLNHAKHHVYKHADQLNGFSGFAFAAQDGFSQGIQLVVATFFVPVHIGFVLFLEIFVAFWTIYIHTDVLPLPWPMMGCNYHYLHHKYNWYNFGFMTVFWDTVFKTVKHPGPKDYLPPTAFEMKHSQALLTKIQEEKVNAKTKST